LAHHRGRTIRGRSGPRTCVFTVLAICRAADDCRAMVGVKGAGRRVLPLTALTPPQKHPDHTPPTTRDFQVAAWHRGSQGRMGRPRSPSRSGAGRPRFRPPIRPRRIRSRRGSRRRRPGSDPDDDRAGRSRRRPPVEGPRAGDGLDRCRPELAPHRPRKSQADSKTRDRRAARPRGRGPSGRRPRPGGGRSANEAADPALPA